MPFEPPYLKTLLECSATPDLHKNWFLDRSWLMSTFAAMALPFAFASSLPFAFALALPVALEPAIFGSEDQRLIH